jgi:hypothetical protein
MSCIILFVVIPLCSNDVQNRADRRQPDMAIGIDVTDWKAALDFTQSRVEAQPQFIWPCSIEHG